MARHEKRQMERFSLELKAWLAFMDKSGKLETRQLISSNVCAGGAFFITPAPLPVGTDVEIGMILPIKGFKKLEGQKSRLDISGSVIWTDSRGMAVCFNKKYNLSAI